MRIVVAHNRYQYAGGEDSVMRSEVEMLRANGHEVEPFEADNKVIDGMLTKISAAQSVFYSRSSFHAMKELLDKFRPDIVHIHNWFPLLSPSIISAAAQAGVPVVQTLHNYRMLCAGARLYRQGKICHDCLGKAFPLGAVLHGCYSGSRMGSAIVSAAFAFHRQVHTWDGVTSFIALTAFQRELLVRGGVDAGRIVVKPNFVKDPGSPGDGRGGYALFVGRLTPEKGIRSVLEAWEAGNISMPLKILGDGPLAAEVRERVAKLATVEYLGHRSRAEVDASMAAARFLVFPSTCYEPFALTILEAFSRGTPVIAANLDSITNLVRHGETGLCFHPGDPLDLAAKIATLVADPAAYAAMRAHCRRLYEENYTESINYGLLMEVYERCIQVSGHSSLIQPARVSAEVQMQ